MASSFQRIKREAINRKSDVRYIQSRIRISKMAESDKAETIIMALKALKALRCNVGQVFQYLGDGIKDSQGEENREKKFLLDLQPLLMTVASNVRDVDSICSSLSVSSNSLSLGNCGQLVQDPTHEKSPIYLQLVQSYKWSDKVHEFASHALSYLNQNLLKRSNINSGLMNKRMRKAPPTSHNVPPQIVDGLIANVSRLIPDMSITVIRPYGNSTILQITLGKTLKALVVLRSLIIEWAIIKGYNEDLYDEDGKLALWQSSRYLVFRKVTEHANAAMLHFYSPLIPDLAVRSFMTWLRSYTSLFTLPCNRCGAHLHDNLPPTWRDLRNLVPYHEACRP